MLIDFAIEEERRGKNWFIVDFLLNLMIAIMHMSI